MWLDNQTDKLLLCGCPNGLDWSVIHENDTVRLRTSADTQVTISPKAYRDTIFAFADTVKAFYEKSSPKPTPDGSFTDKAAYQKFWANWETWRNGDWRA